MGKGFLPGLAPWIRSLGLTRYEETANTCTLTSDLRTCPHRHKQRE